MLRQAVGILTAEDRVVWVVSPGTSVLRHGVPHPVLPTHMSVTAQSHEGSPSGSEEVGNVQTLSDDQNEDSHDCRESYIGDGGEQCVPTISAAPGVSPESPSIGNPPCFSADGVLSSLDTPPYFDSDGVQ